MVLNNTHSTSGSVADSNAGSAMETENYLDELLDDVSCLSGGPTDEYMFEETIEGLKLDMKICLKKFTEARLLGDDVNSDKALQEMEKIKTHMTTVKAAFSALSGCDANGASGLTLNRRDLPKFQLLSSTHRPFPNEEAFESDEHFLVEFENVIDSSSLRIEKVWKKFLPLCIPKGNDSWVQGDLKGCRSWSEARAAFKKQFGSVLVTRRYTDLVFTMTMRSNESIGDYSRRFLQAVHNASLPRLDERISDRFLASLTKPVQTIIRLAMTQLGGIGGQGAWSVCCIIPIGREVLGDDSESYIEATTMIPGARGSNIEMATKRENRRLGGSSRFAPSDGKSFNRTSFGKGKGKVMKTLFCTQHGKNNTHETKDCFENPFTSN
ncbi:hypothetical protein BDB01DRAFT_731428 [Pilobolus umbonatus]|nr:hypothetical protein BDB01DRAFT_731428 [Pilobolus umbonatus]